MTKARKSNTGAEALNFPNPSRSYDVTGHGVRFWGYDQTFEISFYVEAGALSKVNPETRADEVGFLNTFDVNRDRIRDVAGNIYSRPRKAPYIFSYTLTASDF
jgi:hypothetical protein